MDFDIILKRKRSSSGNEHDNSPPLKALKQEALTGDVQGLKASIEGSITSLIGTVDQNLLRSIGQDRSSPGFEIGGAWVTNWQPVAFDSSGKEIHFRSLPDEYLGPTPAAFSEYGLPTPDPSPLPKDTNPFFPEDSTLDYTASASLNGLSNSAYVGDLKLFGLIPSKIYVYEHAGSLLHPYHEEIRISPDGPISLGAFIPSLKGSEWDMISLENPILGFQEEAMLDGLLSRTKGLYFESELVFRGALQPVSDFFQDFFHQDTPSIRFTAWLDGFRDYAFPPTPPSFVLSGSLDHVSVNVLDVLKFRQIGIELNGYQTYNLSDRGRSTWELGYGFFGKLDLSVPGTVIPLQVEYYLRKTIHSWRLQLRLKDDEWNDVFGIKGLKVFFDWYQFSP